ncbi:MAG: hypothetical protein H0T60_02505 [Acidobacteria bacterium]|nr:hypothetical protein [Acidobacteriota bacterium]
MLKNRKTASWRTLLLTVREARRLSNKDTEVLVMVFPVSKKLLSNPKERQQASTAIGELARDVAEQAVVGYVPK